jgi:hypothetical protein
MKHLLLITLSFLLLSSPVIGNNHKGETLYRWGKCCDYKWIGFGEKDTNPKYQGQVENGKPNGLGYLIYPDGEKYVGEWKNGKRNGQGTFTSPDGYKYVGEYKDGKYNGQGTTTFRRGNKYVGEHKDGNIWNGTGYDKDGNITYKIVNGIIKQ